MVYALYKQNQAEIGNKWSKNKHHSEPEHSLFENHSFSSHVIVQK